MRSSETLPAEGIGYIPVTSHYKQSHGQSVVGAGDAARMSKKIKGFLSFGMCPRVICTQLVTSAHWLSGCKNALPLVMTQQITLQCFQSEPYGARV